MRFGRFMNKDAVGIGFLSAGAVAFTINYTGHAFFSRHLAKYYTARGADGEHVEVRATMVALLEETLTDLRFTAWNKNFFSMFACKGIEPMYFGSTKVKEGVWIGIPQYFQAINEDEIIASDLQVEKKLDWTSAEGKQLLESLQLGDNAIKFVMAKQALSTHNYKFLVDSALPTFMTVGFYAAVDKAHSWFKLMEKPILSSIYVHSSIGVVFILMYVFMKDVISLTYEKNVEEKIFKMSEAYIRGGIEYYQKAIQRNKALRNLTKKGASRYSVTGNETSFIRANGLPLTLRLKITEEALEKYYMKKAATEIPTPRKPQPIF